VEGALIGCAGRLEQVKGQDLLVEAIARLAMPDVHLVLAGSGNEARTLQSRVDALGLSHRVHMPGRVDDMPRFYQALDLFCLPSRREGMPLAPLEAQACGVPAVVTDVGGAAETVCPRTGMRVPPNDVTALSAALDRALQRSRAAGTTATARRFVQHHGDIRRTCEAYLALLEAR
jgi:glycosyltransferase involved in cell wall biosynthesis